MVPAVVEFIPVTAMKRAGRDARQMLVFAEPGGVALVSVGG